MGEIFLDGLNVIKVNNVCKNFGENEVLKNISFSINKGETIAIIGPSGSGKSTMLRCLVNLEKADSGDIIIEGEYLVRNGEYPKDKDSQKICSKMGMVFQNFNLFPHMSVLKNLTAAPRFVKNEDNLELKKRAEMMLNKVGLTGREDSMPSQLSGGQKQRVAIARALMINPDILLFDEPTSSLDPQLTAEVLNVMKELARERMTMVVVTHEMGFAREVADRVLFMDETGIVADDVPDRIFANPDSPRIAEFIKSII